MKFIFTGIALSIILQLSFPVSAQVSNWQETHNGSVYFSLGISSQQYFNSTIHIVQNNGGNYNLLSIAGDASGSSDAPFAKKLSYRIGYYLNYNQDFALEICYDPFNYTIPDHQSVHLVGSLDGTSKPVDKSIDFSKQNGYYYNLSGGLGTMRLNFVRRFGVYRKITHKMAIDLLCKAGFGPVMPSSEVWLSGQKFINNATITGSNVGVEAGLKYTTHRHIFLEFDYKYSYTMLSGIPVLGGSASQNIKANTLQLNLGYIFSISKNNQLFTKGWPHRKPINHPKPMYKKEDDI